ncbi:uncharacterized protein DS421_4g126630 [Arachis hypogaea]|nr:uncharacterized protein DS421_4g126630 [Arachis hypogaea]
MWCIFSPFVVIYCPLFMGSVGTLVQIYQILEYTLKFTYCSWKYIQTRGRFGFKQRRRTEFSTCCITFSVDLEIIEIQICLCFYWLRFFVIEHWTYSQVIVQHRIYLIIFSNFRSTLSLLFVSAVWFSFE